MHLWRKLVGQGWLGAHESILQERSGGRLVVISSAGRKRLQLEIACTSRVVSKKLVEEFGGRTEKWSRDWLEQFAARQTRKPLKIGKRLVISAAVSSRAKRGTSDKLGRSRELLTVTDHPARGPSSSARLRMAATRRSHALRLPLLVIPASAAFGTGEHATTAMSLQLLERLTRKWKHGWSLTDLGTGSGILALAAKHFGAGSVTGIDIDPKAISIAKANARLNKINHADFHLGDVREWKPSGVSEIVAANLYSELLIELLPKLKRCNWLVLSGVLRTQENEFLRLLRRNNVEILDLKHRGKWIALAARKR